MMKKLSTILFLVTVLNSAVQAQVNVRDSAVQGFLFNFSLGGYLPGGDAAEVYGFNLAAGLDVLYKTKSNWVLGAGGSYLFGSKIKNQRELLGDLITNSGNIIGSNGDYAEVNLFERGFYVAAKAGKVLPLFGPNQSSGLFIQGGVGYLQHSIEIQNKSQTVIPLLGEYNKGYDQLSGGVMFVQYIGFFHADNRRTKNFTIGFEFQQALTRNYRGYNYGTKSHDTDKKLDLFYGIKASWFIPIYDKNAQKFFYH